MINVSPFPYEVVFLYQNPLHFTHVLKVCGLVFKIKQKSVESITTHRIHVSNIHLHVVLIYGKCR